MMLDLNEAGHWEQDQATAQAREAKNRRRLAAVVIAVTCMALFAGKSAIPRRPDGPRRRRLFGFGNKDNKCDGVVCLNGGDCNSNTGRCVCPTGFTGDSCEIDNSVKDPCEGVVCLNGGACNPNTGTCICTGGFSGPNCETPPQDKCANVFCLHGGVCNENTGLCVCPAGYYGDRCQNKVDKCDGVICFNGGDCNSNTGKCVCLPGFSGNQCQYTVPRVKKVFVTSGTWDGDLGGFGGANAKCRNAANAAGLNGIFKAWLSRSNMSAKNRLTHSSKPYVLVGNPRTRIANNWNDLVSGALDHEINRNEYGNSVGNVAVWTGTDKVGVKLGAYCNGWTSAGQYGRIGRTNFKDEKWTNRAENACSLNRHLYCFEQ